MKKIYAVLAAAAIGVGSAFAQTSPDRVIIKQTNGEYKSYLADRIDELVFEKVYGDVRADVKVLSFTEGDDPTVTVSVMRTEECQSFRIAVVPPMYSAYIEDPATAAKVIESLSPNSYYEDFTNGEMSGFESPFLPDVDYTVFTVGYDKFGTACEVSKDTFHTKKSDIVGNPQVTATVLDVQSKSFTIKFEGNLDCGQYYLCAFDKSTGGLDAEFAMWGPMFGFNTPNEMIAMFAQEAHTGTYTNTWSGMTPGTDYEVWIAMQDTKGNFADPACIEVSTLSLGDEGVAQVSITVGEFSQETDPSTGDVTYWQRMIFTPNSSCAFFRDILIDKSYIESFNVTEKIDGVTATGEEGLIEYLKNDQPMNPYWNLYETDDWKWSVNPGTTYVAYSIGQNAKGEWGPVASKEFTTLGSASAPAKANGVATRGAYSGVSHGVGTPAVLTMGKRNANVSLK